MLLKTRMMVWIVLLVALAAIVTLIGTSGKPTVAQDTASESFYDLLTRLNTENTSMTFQFDQPFASGETLLKLPDLSLHREFTEIGQDFFCFSEPWNDGQRIHCTPYTNIVGLTYDE